MSGGHRIEWSNQENCKALFLLDVDDGIAVTLVFSHAWNSVNSLQHKLINMTFCHVKSRHITACDKFYQHLSQHLSPLSRCAVNTSSGNMETVMNAMEGFIDTLPGSRADIPSYTEVRAMQCYTLGFCLSST